MGKIPSIRTKNKMGDSDSGGSSIYTGRSIWLTLALCCGAVGCTTVKKAAVVATGAAVGATAGTVLSGGCDCTDSGSHDNCFCGRCGNGDISSDIGE